MLSAVLALSLACSGQIQIVSEADEAAFRSALPYCEDAKWNKLFSNENLLFYTSREMPRSFQHHFESGNEQFAGKTSFHLAAHNFSGDADEAVKGEGNGGNANVEFPWKHPGGTDESASRGLSTTFKFMLLPGKPIVYWRGIRNNSLTGNDSTLEWIHPVGTIFGEVLLLKSGGTWHTFEVRLRIREYDYIDVAILRPFDSNESLVTALKRINRDDLAATFAVPRRLVKKTLFDGGHPVRAFNVTAGVDTLPSLPEALAASLIDTTPFKDVTGGHWAKDGELYCFAPTTTQSAHIVPFGYRGTFLGLDSAGCMNCHQHTLTPARRFDQQRGWYGFVGGSTDFFFTSLPVKPENVLRVGGSTRTFIRDAFYNTGMVEPYNPAKHPDSTYHVFKP